MYISQQFLKRVWQGCDYLAKCTCASGAEVESASLATPAAILVISVLIIREVPVAVERSTLLQQREESGHLQNIKAQCKIVQGLARENTLTRQF